MDAKVSTENSVCSKKKNRTVEVVLFQDPSKKSEEKRKREEVKRITKAGTKFGKKPRNDKAPGEADFKSMFEDVKDFGITGFSKQDRKKMEQHKAQSLGAWKPKGQKMPYPLLQSVLKKRKEREKARIETEKAMGIYVKKKQERKDKRPNASGWWVNKTIKIDSPSNNFKLKNSDLKAIQRKIAK